MPLLTIACKALLWLAALLIIDLFVVMPLLCAIGSANRRRWVETEQSKP